MRWLDLAGPDLVAGAPELVGWPSRLLAPLPSGRPLSPAVVVVCSRAGWWRRRFRRRDTGVVASSLPEVVGFIGPVYKMLDGFMCQIRVKP
jgi:hypothetical protein